MNDYLIPRSRDGQEALPVRAYAYRGGPPPPGGAGYGEDEVNLRDAWGVLRRRKWTVIAALGLVLLSVGTFTWLKTPVWRASTLIRVEDSDKSNVAVLDVLASLQRGSEIETEMRILRTRPIIEDVVDGLNLQFRLERPAGFIRSRFFLDIEFDRTTPARSYEVKRTGADRYRLESVDDEDGEKPLRLKFAAGEQVRIPGGRFVLKREEEADADEPLPAEFRIATVSFPGAVRGLTGALQVTRPGREANVMQVAYEGTDRDLARRIPNAVAASFIDQRHRVQKLEVKSTVTFLKEQSELLQKQLEAAESGLQEFREARQIVALGSEAEEQVKRLAELQTQRTQLAAERSALANLLRGIDASGAEAAEYRKLAAFPTFLRNQAIANLLQALTAAESTRSALLSRFTRSHPDVIQVTGRIEQLEGQLGDIGRNYLSALDDQIASLDAVLARFGTQLEEIPAKEVQFARLERQTKLLGDLYTLLQTRLKEAQIAEAVEDPSVRVVEAAILPNEPVSPRPARNMAFALVLGLMLGVGFAFVREYLDTRIHSGDNVEETIGLAPIGRIPALPLANGGRRSEDALVTVRAGSSVGAEAFRTLRTNVRFVRGGVGAKEMIVTSPGAREGKSVTAANLAAAFALQGIRTLLIDADMRRSVQHFYFGMEREPGLAGLLAGVSTLLDAVRHTEVEGLDLLPAGTVPPNPAELLGGVRMDDLLANARGSYDALVIDTPPMLAVTDATVLGPKVEGVVLVVRAEQTDRDAASHAIWQLRQVGATVLGVVLNDAKADGAYSYYRYYHSYYGGDEKKRHGLKRLLPFGS